MSEAIPPAVAPPPGNPRFPLVDGVRAIAALSVLFFHAGIGSSVPLVYAYQFASGVPIFFLVSGFLLYRPFVAGRLRDGRKIRVRDFARRRLLRIVPAYWVALTLLAIYPTLSGGVFGSRAPIYYGFAQDYFQGTLFGGLGVAWSLCTEMSFYLLLPFYALLLARLTRRRSSRTVLRIEFGVLLLLSIGSFVFRLAEAGPHINLAHALPGTFGWFAFGMALAVVVSVAASALVGGASYYVVERPFLNAATGRLSRASGVQWYQGGSGAPSNGEAGTGLFATDRLDR